MERFLITKEETQKLKGIFAILIILHHCIQFTNLYYPFSLGHLFVGIFFFLSGYGLQVSYDLKNDYLKGFFRKRVAKVYVEFIYVTAIYIIFRSIMGIRYSVTNIFKSLYGGFTIVNFSWYIMVIIVFYSFFYISHKIAKKNSNMTLLLFIISYIGICYIAKLELWWYISVGAFWVGCIWKKILIFMNCLVFKHKNSLFLLTITVFTMSYLKIISKLIATLNIHQDKILKLVEFTELFVSSILFCIIVIIIKSLNKSKSVSLFSKVGDISGELYLMQGIPIILFATCSIKNNFVLYTLSVLIVTLALSILLKSIMYAHEKVFKAIK